MLSEVMARPVKAFVGGDVGAIRTSAEPRVVPLGTGIGVMWEWDVFYVSELTSRLPQGSEVCSSTLSLPTMIAGVNGALLGKASFTDSAYRSNRLFARSIDPGTPKFKLVSGRLLGQEDDGQSVALLSTWSRLAREKGIGVGDEITCLVPKVKPGRGAADVIGIPVDGLGGRYLDFANSTMCGFRIVGVIDEPLLGDFGIVTPLSTLQNLSGAGNLVNLVGLRAADQKTMIIEARYLGGGFYEFGPGFVSAPLSLQLEALVTQGNLLVMILSVLSGLVLVAVTAADLSQRRREHSLLQALGLTKGELAYVGLWRGAGVIVASLALILAPILVVAVTLTNEPVQTLRVSLPACWPVIVLVIAAAFLSVLMAPRLPMEGLADE
jgi:hypothetical protein